MENKIANFIYTYAVVYITLSVLGCIYILIEYNWYIALIALFSSVTFGMSLFGFAEIIELLNKINKNTSVQQTEQDNNEWNEDIPDIQ